MLYQGGFFERKGTVKKFTYVKTDLAKLPEEKLANALMDCRDKMFGYNQADPSKRMLKKAQVIAEVSGLPPLGDVRQIPSDVESQEGHEADIEDRIALAASYSHNGHPDVHLKTPPAPPKLKVVEEPRVEPDDVEDTPAKKPSARQVFMDLADDYDKVKAILPNLSVREFMIMWLRGSGKV